MLDPPPDPRTPVSTQTGRRPNTVAHGFTGLTYLRDRKISQDMFLCKYMSIFYIHLHLCVSVYLYEYLCPYVYYIDASSCVCVSASTCINYLFKVILQRCPIDSCFKCLMRCSWRVHKMCSKMGHRTNPSPLLVMWVTDSDVGWLTQGSLILLGDWFRLLSS